MSLDDLIAGLKDHRLRLLAEAAAVGEAIFALEGHAAGPDIADPPGATPLPPARVKSPDCSAPAGKAAPLRKKYSDDEKAEAVALARRVGAAEAARQLGIYYSIVNRWRREGSGPPPEPQRVEPRRPNPIERSPHAGQGHMVPSGVRAPIDVDQHRNAAWDPAVSLG